MTREQEIVQVERHGRLFKGRKPLLAHLRGERVTRGMAIWAKCYDCCGYFQDGTYDCGVATCPLYQYMPYREGRPSGEGEDDSGHGDADAA